MSVTDILTVGGLKLLLQKHDESLPIYMELGSEIGKIVMIEAGAHKGEEFLTLTGESFYA